MGSSLRYDPRNQRLSFAGSLKTLLRWLLPRDRLSYEANQYGLDDIIDIGSLIDSDILASVSADFYEL
jgi:hypothetical protein